VAGGALQPWKVRGGRTPPVLDAPGLREFAVTGWVKVSFAFVLEDRGAETLLTTETRVEATDARTRVLFGVYWTLIRVGSGLTRRDMLRAVARASRVGMEASPLLFLPLLVVLLGFGRQHVVLQNERARPRRLLWGLRGLGRSVVVVGAGLVL
jgi:hypothetical protein